MNPTRFGKDIFISLPTRPSTATFSNVHLHTSLVPYSLLFREFDFRDPSSYYLCSNDDTNSSLSSLIADLIPYRSTDGPSPAAHMVATVAVYFNPAKTLGGMMEADIYCIGGAAFAAVVTLLSMDSFWFFELKPGWEWLADLIT